MTTSVMLHQKYCDKFCCFIHLQDKHVLIVPKHKNLTFFQEQLKASILREPNLSQLGFSTDVLLITVPENYLNQSTSQNYL